MNIYKVTYNHENSIFINAPDISVAIFSFSNYMLKDSGVYEANMVNKIEFVGKKYDNSIFVLVQDILK
jgi:hypothetical protein